MKSANKKEENTATLLAAIYKVVPGFYMPVFTYCSANKKLYKKHVYHLSLVTVAMRILMSKIVICISLLFLSQNE
jgi:hypothetical protein